MSDFFDPDQRTAALAEAFLLLGDTQEVADAQAPVLAGQLNNIFPDEVTAAELMLFVGRMFALQSVMFHKATTAFTAPAGEEEDSGGVLVRLDDHNARLKAFEDIS